jgi:hypothetical protein
MAAPPKPGSAITIPGSGTNVSDEQKVPTSVRNFLSVAIPQQKTRGHSTLWPRTRSRTPRGVRIAARQAAGGRVIKRGLTRTMNTLALSAQGAGRTGAYHGSTDPSYDNGCLGPGSRRWRLPRHREDHVYGLIRASQPLQETRPFGGARPAPRRLSGRPGAGPNDGIQTATRFAEHRGRRGTAGIAVRSSGSASASHRGYNSIVRYRIDPATYLRSIDGLTDGCAPAPFRR